MIEYVAPEPAALASPCTGVCALEATRDWCLGCGRTIDEIADWSGLAPAERTAVLAMLPARLAELRVVG